MLIKKTGIMCLHFVSSPSLNRLKHFTVLVCPLFACLCAGENYQQTSSLRKNEHIRIDITPVLPHDIFNFNVTLFIQGS